MKDLVTCVLAMTWVWGLIWLLGRRKHPYERPDNIDREFREMVAKRLRPCLARLHHATVGGCNCQVYTHAHDEHGASSYSPDIIDQTNRAHTTGQVRCPIHGSACGRAARARETGLSQTDDDVGRRAASGQSAD